MNIRCDKNEILKIYNERDFMHNHRHFEVVFIVCKCLIALFMAFFNENKRRFSNIQECFARDGIDFCSYFGGKILDL